MTQTLATATLAAVLFVAWPAAALPETSQTRVSAADGRSPAARLIDQAYEAAYNLNHDEGIALARRAVALAPESAGTHRALASMLWMKILFGRGAVTVGHYMSGMSNAQKHLPDPPADLDAEFRRELDRAEALADARLAREPNNVAARYDVGAIRGLRASYTASIEGSLRAAFGTARGAFNAQESVLDLEPDHVQANVVVGTYRYLVSSLGLMSRWLAYVAGFGGGRERGIEMIESALETGGAMVEAGTALMLIYSREERHDDTHRLALRLAERYPGNRLFRLEAGAAGVRAGLNDQAEAILSRGLDALETDTRPRVPGERAIWLYQRGLARLQQDRLEEAAADLRAALESEPYGWMRGRILIGLGKLHDLHGRRGEAREAYAEGRAICEALDDVIGAEMARALERTPYSLDGGPGR